MIDLMLDIRNNYHSKCKYSRLFKSQMLLTELNQTV